MARASAFALAYVLLTLFAFAGPYRPGELVPLWAPAGGLVLGILVRAPRRVWPALLGTQLGALLVGLLLAGLLGLQMGPVPLAPTLWGISSILPPLVGAALLVRHTGRPNLESLRDIASWVLLGVLVPGLVGGGLCLVAWALWPGEVPIFRPAGWLGAYALGQLSMAPLLLTAPLPGERWVPARRRTEALALLVVAVCLTLASFMVPAPPVQLVLLGSIIFPLIGWAALRFGARGVAWTIVVLSAAIVWRTFEGESIVLQSPPWIRITYQAAYLSLAQISGFILAAVEAGRRLAFARKEEALAQLHTLLQNAPVGIALHDRELRFLEANDALAAINGMPSAEMIGRRPGELLSTLGAEIERHLEQALLTGQPEINVEVEGKTPGSGEHRVWLVTYFPIAAEGRPPLGVSAIVADITERRRQEAALRQSEERLRVLAESTADIIYTTNAEGIPVLGEAAWCRFTGQSAETFHSLRWMEAVHPEDVGPLAQVWSRALHDGTPARARYRLRRHDGAWRQMVAIGVPIRAADGTVREWVGQIVDETERIEAEEERERALHEAQEAIRIRDDFLTIASHELKTPLTPLAMRLQALQRRAAAGQRIDPEALARARRSLEKLTGLIHDLLDVSRIREARLATRRELVDLRALVEDAAGGYRDRSTLHHLTLDLEPSAFVVAGERNRLAQVVDILIDNAFTFSPAGGAITVALERKGEEAHLSVADHGIGIPAADLPRLFDRFFHASNVTPRSYGGLGLGLYISKEIVDRHGGRIWAESVEGRGSTFHVVLPLSPKGASFARPVGRQGTEREDVAQVAVHERHDPYPFFQGMEERDGTVGSSRSGAAQAPGAGSPGPHRTRDRQHAGDSRRAPGGDVA